MDATSLAWHAVIMLVAFSITIPTALVLRARYQRGREVRRQRQIQRRIQEERHAIDAERRTRQHEHRLQQRASQHRNRD